MHMYVCVKLLILMFDTFDIFNDDVDGILDSLAIWP